MRAKRITGIGVLQDGLITYDTDKIKILNADLREILRGALA